MNELGVDILGVVLGYLPERERIRCILVCKLWQRAFRKAIRGWQIASTRRSRITNAGLSYLSGVHTIDLWGCSQATLTDVGFSYD